MPKQPIAVELEAINREGEAQVVRDSGLTVQGLRAVEAGGLALATWVADYDTVDPVYELAGRLSHPAERVGSRVADADEE